MCRWGYGRISVWRMLSGFAATGADGPNVAHPTFTVILAHHLATRQAYGKYPSNGVGNDASTRVAQPMPETFSPSRASKQTGVPMSTLRIWARQYSQFFSPDANPQPGSERRFTVQDVEVLKAISQLRANGLDATEIAERLRQGNIEPPERPTMPVSVQSDAIAPQNAIQTFLAHAGTKLDDVAGKVDDVDRRVERLESQQRHFWMLVIVALLGVGVGAVLVAAAVWLAGMVR
jgi:DNA-binding transcriptional MerR regulator